MAIQTKEQTVANRIYNFSPGPATLPVSVLETIQQEVLNYKDSGMSVLEMSHRSAAFESIIQETESNLRKLLNISTDYKVLFLQGGATLQFSMLPMNLLTTGKSADYIITGHWAQSALKEAKKIGQTKIAATAEKTNFDLIPNQTELNIDPQAAYLHFTSNNTIHGTQWISEPQSANGVPLACDASSDILSRPLDVSKYGIIYAGAQKNMGPAGVTIVIIREDLLKLAPPNLPTMLDYKQMADKDSLYNTPPTFAIYVTKLVTEWLLDLGGLEAIAKRNTQKAHLLYETIDNSSGFYRGHARPNSRSKMNVTFRLPSEELEKKFVRKSAAEGFDGLQGHRLVGGLRASIYNAFPLEGVEQLSAFMTEFQKRNS